MDVSRYVNTTDLHLDVEFITPAFLGGWNGNAEIRTAPFKHGIRYWWRILYGAKYGNKIKEIEDKIFGSTENAANVQIYCSEIPKASFTEKIGFSGGKKIAVSHGGRDVSVNILDYLAYGKFEHERGQRNVYTSTYIKPTTKIKIQISIKDVGHTEEVKNAIKIFFCYGGVGSRSRNGFGSMDTNFGDIQFSKNVSLCEIKEFPTFSQELRFFITKKPLDTWENALSEIGIMYKDARCSLERPHRYEKRGFIARPIEARGEEIPSNIKKGRIPKPFYMGIMKYEKQFIGYILCLPIMFYEQESQKEYMKQIRKMTEHFSTTLKDDTARFLKPFSGAAK